MNDSYDWTVYCVLPDMARRIHALSNKNKRVSLASTEVELRVIHEATASEHEYIFGGDRIQVNGAFDEQIVRHSARTEVVVSHQVGVTRSQAASMLYFIQSSFSTTHK